MYCSAVVMVLLAGFKFGECPRLEGKQPPSILGNQKKLKAERVLRLTR